MCINEINDCMKVRFSWNVTTCQLKHIYKMAPIGTSRTLCSKNKFENVCSVHDKCTSCIALQTEVSKLEIELKSAWEIIRILQENDNNKNVTDARATISRPKVSVPVPWNKIEKGRQRNRVMNKNLINMNLINIPLLNKSSMLKKPTGQCWSYKQKDSGLESGQKWPHWTWCYLYYRTLAAGR